MVEEKPTDFKIRIDEESPDIVFQDEIRNLRLEKLSKKVTIISIVIPCLLCIILLIGYIDLRNKVTKNQSTGAVNVQNLSKDFNTRLYDLSSQFTKLEESIAANILSTEKKISSLKFKAYKADNRIKKINSSKADKKEQETLKGDIKNFSTKVDALDNVLSQKLTELTSAINRAKEDIAKLNADTSNLSAQKLDRKLLDIELKKENKNQQQKLSRITKDLEKKLLSIQKKVEQLEKSLQYRLKPDSAVKPPQKTTPSKPGKIIEKDI